MGNAADDARKNRLTYEDAFPLSDKEFRDYTAQPHVFAAFENFLTIHYNIKETFHERDTLAQNVVTKLEGMPSDY